MGVLGRTATVLSTFFGFVRKGTKHLSGLYLRARTEKKYSRAGKQTVREAARHTYRKCKSK